MPYARHESLGCLCKGYVMEINDCKQRRASDSIRTAQSQPDALQRAFGGATG